MANVQPDEFTKIANELLEEIPKYKFNGTQLRIVMVIWRYTYGFKRKEHAISVTFLKEATGISYKQVKTQLSKLIDNKIIHVIKEAGFNHSRILAFNKDYDQWKIEKSIQGNEKDSGEQLTPTQGNKSTPPQGNDCTPKKEIFKDNFKDIDDEEEIHEELPEEKPNLFEDIINFFCEKTGRIQINISSTDFQLVKELLEKGIPPDVIKQGIELSIKKHKPQFEGDRINSISYCRPKILELFEKKKVKNNVVILERGEQKNADSNKGSPAKDYGQNGKNKKFFS